MPTTRTTVTLTGCVKAVLVAELAEGRTWSEVVRGHPELSEEDVRAALEYASEAVEHTEFMDVVAG